jgi:hypothetical protein
MQDLHRDASALGMDGAGHQTVVGEIGVREEPRRALKHRTFVIGRHTACNDQADPTARPSGVIGRNPPPVAEFFQARVHGPHKNAVRQLREAEVERFEKAGIRRVQGLFPECWQL